MAQTVQKWCVLAILLIILALAVVGFGTPSWYRVQVASTINPLEYTAGFFEACTVERSTIATDCSRYTAYVGINVYDKNYIGCIIFNILGILFVVAAMVPCTFTLWDPTGVCGCVACFTDKRKFIHVTWLTLMSGICLLITVIWFGVAVVEKKNGVGILGASGTITADYSLALVAVACAVALIFAIVMSILVMNNYFSGVREVVVKREEIDDLTIQSEYSKREPLALPEPVYTIARPDPVRMVQSPPQIVHVPQPYMVRQPPQVKVVQVPKPVIQRQIVREIVERPVHVPVPQQRQVIIQQQAPMPIVRRPMAVRLPALPPPPIIMGDPIYVPEHRPPPMQMPMQMPMHMPMQMPMQMSMGVPPPYIVTEPEPYRLSRSKHSKRYSDGFDTFGDSGDYTMYDNPYSSRGPFIP